MTSALALLLWSVLALEVAADEPKLAPALPTLAPTLASRHHLNDSMGIELPLYAQHTAAQARATGGPASASSPFRRYPGDFFYHLVPCPLRVLVKLNTTTPQDEEDDEDGKSPTMVVMERWAKLGCCACFGAVRERFPAACPHSHLSCCPSHSPPLRRFSMRASLASGSGKKGFQGEAHASPALPHPFRGHIIPAV